MCRISIGRIGFNWQASFRRPTEQAVRPNPQDIYFIKMPRMWHSIFPTILEKLEQAILKHHYIDVYYNSQTKRAWSH